MDDIIGRAKRLAAKRGIARTSERQAWDLCREAARQFARLKKFQEFK